MPFLGLKSVGNKNSLISREGHGVMNCLKISCLYCCILHFYFQKLN